MKLEYKYDTNSTSYDNNGSMREQKVTVPTANGTAGFTATQTYSYDALNRLGSAEETIAGSTTLKQTFEIDRYGNRRFDTSTSGLTTTLGSCTTMCNPTFDATNNRITSSGFSFDSSGNTTRDAADRKFTYDAENKQTKAETLSAGTNTVTGTIGEYSYDGDGRRVKKYVPSTGETTIFVYDAGGKQIAEYSTVVASANDAKVAYLTADHLGSPRINTDVGGAVIARHDYHPFGEEIYTSQRTTALAYAADSVRKQFTGYERDGETGLDYAQARYYASGHGRFSSPDDFLNDSDASDPQSWGKYVYVRNRPTTLTDSTGMCTPQPGKPCVKAPTITGPNNVPKQPNRENVPNIGQLGYKDAVGGGYVTMNVESEFAPGDNIGDYKTLRTAILPGGEVRSGSDENPSKSQTNVAGNSKFVTDSLGMSTSFRNDQTGETSTIPKANLETRTYVAVLSTAEYNTKSKSVASNVSYYGVKIVYGKNGTIDQSKSQVVALTKAQFTAAAKQLGAKIPKDKNKVEDADEMLKP